MSMANTNCSGFNSEVTHLTKNCPFCKVKMYRPKQNFCKTDDAEPMMTMYCSSYKDHNPTCEREKDYYDYECPNCYGLFLYRK